MLTVFRSLFAPPRHLILLLVALWLGISLSERRASRYGISKELLSNLVFYSILGYIAGGRLLFILQNLSAFSKSPWSVFSINIDLFDHLGALATAVIVGFAYGQRNKLALWSTLDALTPLFATVAMGLALAHLAAGTAFGKPTTLPWGIDLWNANRHPTQIYELIVSLLIFGILWFRKNGYPGGSEFLLFTALTAGARLFLETFRGDSILVFGGVRLAQVIAWILLGAAFIANEALRGEQKVV